MKAHKLAVGTLALLATAVARPAASPPLQSVAPLTSKTAVPYLHVSGGRSAQQHESVAGQKLDTALADITRHASLVRPEHTLLDLHAMNPAARFMQSPTDAGPLVLIDALTRGDPQQLKNALVALGLQRASVYSNDVSGWLPVAQIDAASARAELHSIHAAMPRARSGAITSQGDFAQRTDILRTAYPTLTGTGIKVGILSDSYNCYPVYAQNGVPASGTTGYAQNGFTVTAAGDLGTGDLPSGVSVLEEASCMQYDAPTRLPFGDEGRAMMQIVHDVAPGAALAFHTAENGEADFANGVTALAAGGAKVIADDVGYFDEPFFQDGTISQAIDAVAAQGVAYFSAAGNDGKNAYDNTTPSFATPGSGPTAGEFLLNFDNTARTTTTSLPVTIPSLRQGDLIAIVLAWDQPSLSGAAGSPGASSHLNLCISGATGADQITNLDGNGVACTGANGTGAEPLQILIVSNPANAGSPTAAEQLNLVVGLADGTIMPQRIKISVEDNGAGATINSFATNSATLQGHSGAAGGAAVGAAAFYKTSRCGLTPAVLESYSSEGGTPILFNTSGTRLATPVIRQKPDFVGPDGGNDTFLGRKLAATQDQNPILAQCANNASFPNFFGTSAATPHVAAIAALMLQNNSALTPAQIQAALRTSAAPMGSMTPDFSSGYGFVQADAAFALLPPATPSLSFASSTIAPGGSTTLTWSAINATDCAASGGWNGTQQTSGTLTVTAPSTAGTATYTLTCNNANGSAVGSANLTIAAASSGGGGGGGGTLGELTLLVLAAVALARLRPAGDQDA